MRHSSQDGFITKALLLIMLGCIFLLYVYRALIAAPNAFPAPYDLTVTAGESASAISTQLVNDGVIKSRDVFLIAMKALGTDTHISEGEYYFAQPISSIGIALRISGKQFGINKIQVTFPEGYTNSDMADRLHQTFPAFDTTTFLKLTSASQGVLFPDSYKFFATPPPDLVVAALKNNYEEKIAPLRADIAASGHSEADIIIMASIVQKEAKGPTDSPVIAGILWKRLANGMALQVDAAPTTYTHKGLPSMPINNPGLTAIQAALYPTASPYLYYLHDSTGTVHYASTYQQHQQNIKKYL